MVPEMTASFRTRIFEIVESSAPSDWKGRWFDRFMIILILTNVVAVVLETVEALSEAYGGFFAAFELFSVAVFTVEYLARLWVCVEDAHPSLQHPVFGRLRYMMTWMAMIDLIAILPFYLSVLFTVDLRFMRVFRLLRLLKLTRYSSALESFAAVLRNQRRSLGAALVIMLILLIFASSVVFMLEKEAQPEAFASIPHAMWWALATLTTVGYGDVTPVTMWGKVFGGFIMILGIGMFALPAGILATGFAQELRRRDFVVTWQLVARIPLFGNLDAMRIAEIADLLQPRMVPPNSTIVRRGELADAMFVIASGEVEVDVWPEPQRLATGDFFGEIALLTDSKRVATVTSVTDCQLLVLDVGDFRALLHANPDLHQTLTEIMKDRLEQIEDGPAAR